MSKKSYLFDKRRDDSANGFRFSEFGEGVILQYL